MQRTRRSRMRFGAPASWTGFVRSGTDGTPSWGRRGASCRAGSSSGLSSRERFLPTRQCSCSTSRPPTWTPKTPPRSSTTSSRHAAPGRCSSSRTGPKGWNAWTRHSSCGTECSQARREKGMGEDVDDPVSIFFDELDRRGHVDLLEKAQGTLRIDLTDGKKTEHRLIKFDRGDISVSRKNAKADCVFRTDRALFRRIVGGEANGVTAALRGEAAAEGDLELLFLLQRVFPTPTRTRNGKKSTAPGRRQR